MIQSRRPFTKAALATTLGLGALWATPASAQCNGIFPNGTVCGNISGTSRPGYPIPNVLTPGGANGQVQINNGGAFGGITDTQLTARIGLATNALSGAIPAWPNNTTTFFRGDGTYAAVPAPAASSVTYLPGGTGAVSTNVQTALRRYVTAADFGAICNNNPANEATDTAALNAMTAYLNTNPFYGGIIVGTSGETCRMNASLKVYANMYIRGHSRNTRIIWNSAVGAMIEPFNSVNNRTDGVRIDDLILNGQSGAATLCIYMRNASTWSLTNIICQDVQNGFEVSNQAVIPYDASNYNRFYNVIVSNAPGVAYNLIGQSNSNTFIGCRANTTGFGLIDNGNNNSTVNCQWEGITSDALRAAATSINFTSTGDRFENGAGTPVGLRVIAGAISPMILNPYFSGTFVGSEYVLPATNTFNEFSNTNGLRVNGGTPMKSAYAHNFTFDFPSLAAHTTTDALDNNAPLTACTASDEVTASPTSAINAGLIVSALSVNGGVYLRIANITAGAIDPPPLTFMMTCRDRI